VTTVPLDDPAEPVVGGDASQADLGSPAGVGVLDPTPARTATPPTPETAASPRVETLLHPVAWWEGRGHRFLPGAAFPFAVFVVWRLVHLFAAFRQYQPNYSGFWEIATFYDGERYQAILHEGYANSHVLMPNTAFFPLVSWLTAPVYWLVHSDLWSIHLIATVTAIGAFVTVWGVTKEWTNERIARRSVLLMALFPSSLFLWAFYSEGLFILLGAGGVWADRKGKRGLAAICFAGLAATRSIGILLPLVIVAARCIRHGPRLPEIKQRWWAVVAGSIAGGLLIAFAIVPHINPNMTYKALTVPVAAVTLVAVLAKRTTGWWAVAGLALIGAFFVAFLCTGPLAMLAPAAVVFGIWALFTRRLDRWCWIYPLAGLLGFLSVVLVMYKQTGDGLAFIPVQADWGRSLSPAWNSVIEGFQNLYPDERTIMIPALVARNLDLWCVPIILVGLGYLVFSRKEKFPMEAWMIGVAFIILPFVSSVLASFNRFVMADWVLYPAYAAFFERLVWRVRLGFVIAGWAIVALFVRVFHNATFEIPPWFNAMHPMLFVVAAIGGLLVSLRPVYVSWRAVVYTALGAISVWVTWEMVGRVSVDRFVG
jgi:hypothetical protein